MTDLNYRFDFIWYKNLFSPSENSSIIKDEMFFGKLKEVQTKLQTGSERVLRKTVNKNLQTLRNGKKKR